jgi:hypothetical protein
MRALPFVHMNVDEVAAREGVLDKAGCIAVQQQWALQFSTVSSRGPCNQQSAGALQWVPRSPEKEQSEWFAAHDGECCRSSAPEP